MNLLEGKTPRDPGLRARLDAADRRATLLAGLGWILTLSAILGLPGDFWFMGLAPAAGIVTAAAALFGIFFQPYRAGFARALLVLGASFLVVSGLFYLRGDQPVRAVLAYVVPGLLFAGAAFVLAAPRRVPSTGSSR
jgi:hypothetical protein